MGGFGSAQAMITAIKNNNRSVKRKAYDGWTATDKKSKGIEVKPVTKETLKKIRYKLKRQQQNERYINILVVIVSIIVLFLLFKVIGVYFSNLGQIGWEPH